MIVNVVVLVAVVQILPDNQLPLGTRGCWLERFNYNAISLPAPYLPTRASRTRTRVAGSPRVFFKAFRYESQRCLGFVTKVRPRVRRVESIAVQLRTHSGTKVARIAMLFPPSPAFPEVDPCTLLTHAKPAASTKSMSAPGPGERKSIRKGPCFRPLSRG